MISGRQGWMMRHAGCFNKGEIIMPDKQNKLIKRGFDCSLANVIEIADKIESQVDYDKYNVAEVLLGLCIMKEFYMNFAGLLEIQEIETFAKKTIKGETIQNIFRKCLNDRRKERGK